MKTTLKILTILVLGALVSAGLFLAFNNTSLASSLPGLDRGHDRPAFNPAGQSAPDGFQPGLQDREFGHNEGANITRGISEIIGLLIKLTIIVTLILLVQKGISLITKKRANTAASMEA